MKKNEQFTAEPRDAYFSPVVRSVQLGSRNLCFNNSQNEDMESDDKGDAEDYFDF